eukprot:gene11795-2173_t
MAAAKIRMILHGRLLMLIAIIHLRIALSKEKKKTKRKRKFWVRPHLKERKNHGQIHTLFSELKMFDREYFFRLIRMSPERYEHLLQLVTPYIQKEDTRMRETIYPSERLV